MSSKNRLIYLPLGGAGEIGMNAYVYGYGPADNERLILVDVGVTFPEMENTPGVDLIFADIAWLEARADRLEAIFITHAHEDHVGALGLLWPRLKAPVYTRAFTGNIAARKLEEKGQDPSIIRVVAAYPEKIKAGPFTVSFLPVSHSIPESSGMVIDTPAGRLVHTGDFKLDETPGVGDPFDPALWAEVAGKGVKALICDSTNVFSPNAGRSESSVGPAIRQLVQKAEGMVVATTFASNIARVKTLAEAGRDAGRSVVLLGRAMRRMVEAGVESGVLTDFPTTVPPEDAVSIPRDHLMLIVTGSQGERRAASAQLSRGKYLGLSMKEGDMFLFSSKTIPGNEKGVIHIVNAFSEMGVDVVDDAADLYHVSGHANRPDLETVHKIMKPQMVVPMHGEHRHLREHVKLAAENGFAAAIATNGTMLDLSGKAPRVVGQIEAGRTYLDGSVQIGALDGIVRDRIRLALNGLVMVTLIIDEDDEPLGEPWVELKGLPETGSSNAALAEVLEGDLAQLIARADDKTLADDDKLEDLLRRRTRQVALQEIGRKPEVVVVISRLVA
ncbi:MULTISPECIES: ribonuclease J [Actibacterium]|uniref:Ribonuclease J n=1 Tax=Actibacterium naphthalenivorans TaxID=1614693 RepID=A0A840C4K0_9RHOB|nr:MULTISPECIES: ribonuclease J [Actibacterium]ALG89900.1 metallo-beta-lactamase [Actibacterium sp. EMB200-NS6]MBB4020375.1 ribonuclease J [Actibacterium naphthalenivorans]